MWLDSSAGTGNRILANSIFANGGLAIDLDARGATANDAGDGDTGANNLQNYPVLTSVQELLTSYLMTGSLDSNPSTTYRLDFYHDACSPLGVPARGNMYEPVGFATVTTDVGGHASFSLPIAHTPNVVLRSVAATATDPSGNTSEIGECVAETPFDQIFKNGFE